MWLVRIAALSDGLIQFEGMEETCACEFMSALPSKADMCGATRDVRYGPIAEIYSITSSAMERIPAGMVRPSALAVLRLITSSNFVGCNIGKSAAFSPLRIRPTYTPTKWYISVRRLA